MEKYGINLISFNTENKSSKKNLLFEQKNNKTEIINNPSENANQEKHEELPKPVENHNNIFPSCPKCGHIAKFDTTYCLRCGYKLK